MVINMDKQKIRNIFKDLTSKETVNLELSLNQVCLISKELELLGRNLTEYSTEVTTIEHKKISEILDEIKDILLQF